jgi:hypothetical protein
MELEINEYVTLCSKLGAAIIKFNFRRTEEYLQNTYVSSYYPILGYVAHIIPDLNTFRKIHPLFLDIKIFF